MADTNSEVIDVTTTSLICYTTTTTFIIKSDLRPDQRQYDKNGNPTTRLWARERLLNEAAALKLIAEKTTIPVPKVIGCGTRDGIPYLEMERIHGIECNMAGLQYRMPNKPGHHLEEKCSTCQQMATANATRFIKDVVLPQLETLKSNTTGLNGFVMPSVWVLNYDRRQHWTPRVSNTDEFVFCHGDLVDHNIMCDPKTLEATYLYDFEHAGFFPPECQLWTIGQEAYVKMFEDTATLQKLVALISP